MQRPWVADGELRVLRQYDFSMGLSMHVVQLGWEQWKLLRRVVKQGSKHRRGESQCQLNYKLVDNHGR